MKERLPHPKYAIPNCSLMTLGSGWSTPTISESDEVYFATPSATPSLMEKEEEYFQSKRRIQNEAKREQKEALRLLCNDPKANRVVARAAEVEWCRMGTTNGFGRVRSRRAPTPLDGIGAAMMGIDEGDDGCGGGDAAAAAGCSSPIFDYSRHTELGRKNELVMGVQLATATVWERLDLRRKTEEVATRAMSLDALLNKSRQPQESQTTHTLEGFRVTEVEEIGSDEELDEEEAEEWNAYLESVVTLAKKPIIDRRCRFRPPSPQPIPPSTSSLSFSPPSLPPRRGSEGMISDLAQCHAPRPLPFTRSNSNPSSSSTSSSPLSSRVISMGANRLQRSFESSRPQPVSTNRPPVRMLRPPTQ